MNDFAGRVAIVTGAAGALGCEFARQAAALGMKLVLADQDAAALERLTDTLLASGAEVLAMVCDVGVCAHVEELADAAMIRFHGVHLLFNDGSTGAHAAAAGAAWDASEAVWKSALDAGLWGAIHAVRIFTPLMIECARRDAGYRGHIVNTASVDGLANAPARAIGNVCGHALLALAETLHHDLRRAAAPIGVSVLCLPPASTGGADAQRPPAAALAGLAFDAVRSGAFYVPPQPQALDALEGRLRAIADGRAPFDPGADAAGGAGAAP
ncbi:SDR family NAD(P)-dependent oxidoreductase [Massilia forsythiae]|uniref:SDR family NAD(P)-dependent oxidoreductase n=1 Tax=Massilia forsythiae TaxID=2728020 RepID=A0A7Z2W087_9BURK|nr:SDR family NAD(P)-dependent oxidoreductase [Massilia forsythiae]QJE02370.1 SDR family NAD(P)-dependent oxidoreductase [Massilia forsythiae]